MRRPGSASSCFAATLTWRSFLSCFVGSFDHTARVCGTTAMLSRMAKSTIRAVNRVVTPRLNRLLRLLLSLCPCVRWIHLHCTRARKDVICGTLACDISVTRAAPHHQGNEQNQHDQCDRSEAEHHVLLISVARSGEFSAARDYRRSRQGPNPRIFLLTMPQYYLNIWYVSR